MIADAILAWCFIGATFWALTNARLVLSRRQSHTGQVPGFGKALLASVLFILVWPRAAWAMVKAWGT